MIAARMRKALVAAGTAALGSLALGLFTEIPKNKAGWVALLVGAFCIGIAAGQATYRVRNEGPDIGPTGSEAPDPQYEAFKAAWDEAMKKPHAVRVLPDSYRTDTRDDDGPLSPGDRRG